MKGDPNPVCLSCGEFVGESLTTAIQIPDGRLICIPCYAPRKQRDEPTWLEIDAAIQSIRKAAG